MPHIDSIQIRDPFVLVDRGRARYHLFGSTDSDIWTGPPTGFDSYTSGDLEHWEGPSPAFRPPAGFWADRQFWAPEVHEFDGGYLMLATFSDGTRRGTQALRADIPEGPYLTVGDGPLTPDGWSCLDGTLHVDADQRPWLVFCREWTDVVDGQILAAPLRPDLAGLDAEPTLLFTASSSPWARSYHPGGDRRPGWITDGPFVLSLTPERLGLLWSSLGDDGYAMGVATSDDGILGPWVHDPEPLWSVDGGHGMTFRTLAGEQRLALHQPNTTPWERAVLAPIEMIDGRLRLSR